MTSRRHFVQGASALAAGSVLAGCHAPGSTVAAPAGTLWTPTASRGAAVLVHGAWHGGWCWAPVQQRLAAAGWQSFAPTLTGLGARAHLAAPVPDLSRHIEDVVRFVTHNDLQDIVLVGHSYGGMVVTGAADRLGDRVHHLVYLDAALPDHGDSMLSHEPDSTPESAAAALAQLKSLAQGDGWLAVPPLPVLGLPDDGSALSEWVKARLTPHPLPSWTQPVTLRRDPIAARGRSFLWCEQQPSIPSFAKHAARVRSDPRFAHWRYRALASAHDAMLLVPDQVAEEILAVRANASLSAD